ncbi:hypothetical protein E1301_Tti022392 [Triplophysa tibetana]|uniref:Uncharacterized protein n=1 Tax=Triplophysa tibetana TaxID=1572043 RepID=A0A5A9NRV1_9TELE|nr:hypothetical protein E1301_Tti022392 [Triplophysa tibetana]
MEPGVGAVCTALRPQEPRIPGLARVTSLLLPLELDPGVELRFVRAGFQSPSDAASDVSSTSHIVSECVREDPDDNADDEFLGRRDEDMLRRSGS